MRNGNQLLGLLLTGLGVAALCLLPPVGSVRELVELQMSMYDLARSGGQTSQPPFLLNYAWAIRSGGWFAIVIGVGSLVVPWINALIYRRPNVIEFMD